MPSNTTTHDDTSDSIAHRAATTGRASIVNLRAAKGARLFCRCGIPVDRPAVGDQQAARTAT